MAQLVSSTWCVYKIILVFQEKHVGLSNAEVGETNMLFHVYTQAKK